MHAIADCSGQACLIPEGSLAYGATPAGNAFMLAAFAALILPNLYTGIRYKTPLHTILLIVALVLEVFGHAGKVLLHSNPSSHAYAAIYLMGTHWGAVLVGSAINQVLPHALVIYGQEFQLISNPIHVNIFFFVMDIFTLAFQSVGIGFASTASSMDELNQGVYFLLAGLGIQALGLLAFLAIYRYFRYKLSHRRYILDDTFSAVFLSKRFRYFMIIVQLASILILIRTAVRIAIFASGLASVLAHSQLIQYLLDDTLLLIAAFPLTIYPAGMAFGLAWTATSPLSSSSDSGLRRGIGTLPLRLRGHRRKKSYQITHQVISLPHPSPNTSPRFAPGCYGARGLPCGLPPHPSPRAQQGPEPSIMSPQNNPVHPHHRTPYDDYASPTHMQTVPFLAAQESPGLEGAGNYSRKMWGGGHGGGSYGADANRMVDGDAIWN